MTSILCEECEQGIDATTGWCTPCNAKHFENNFSNWTSENAEIDEFIRNSQINAIRHESYWEEGHLLRWDLKANKWVRNGGQWVKLVTNYSAEKHLCPRILKLESEFSKSNPPLKRLIYGITRNPETKEYAVIESLMDQCPSCGQEWMSPRWCRGCNTDLFKSERSNWTSGNSEIDAFIYEAQTTAEFPEQILEWIPETQFTEFKLIGKGGFGRVFKAYWEKGRICKWNSIMNKWERSEPMWVALKSIEKGDESFIDEVKAMYQCLKINLGSLDCYGITRDPVTQDYLIVMRFVEYGDLRAYLSSTFATSSWKDRLDRLWSLSIDLRSLHRSGLVHRDLHGGNVLFGNNRRNFIADLGLTCKDGQTETGDIKGEKSNDDDDDEINIRNQFKLAELERQKNPFPVVPFSESNSNPLTSRLLPTITLQTNTGGYQTIQYDLEISDDL
ncbi:6685_t:CDS:2 [Funneliformis caledonium]|uniref:6685_t:CDS:1 n=3 Tax=Funneliformis TaxID=1117308 RepID=A0A9N9N879_9GLOM|nr:6685_t:CDS:2 [Funneliformis caledonium]